MGNPNRFFHGSFRKSGVHRTDRSSNRATYDSNMMYFFGQMDVADTRFQNAKEVQQEINQIQHPAKVDLDISAVSNGLAMGLTYFAMSNPHLAELFTVLTLASLVVGQVALAVGSVRRFNSRVYLSQLKDLKMRTLDAAHRYHDQGLAALNEVEN